MCEQLKNLCDNKIRPEQANSCAMLAAQALLSVKLEMDYIRLKDEEPNMKFMEYSGNSVKKTTRLIENKS
ncbi:MAG: hypothetical protein AABY22_22585 [Nanoarchaeota archaeon]